MLAGAALTNISLDSGEPHRRGYVALGANGGCSGGGRRVLCSEGGNVRKHGEHPEAPGCASGPSCRNWARSRGGLEGFGMP